MRQFTLITGPMFAGKTEELIRLAGRREHAGDNVVCVRHAWDDRYEIDNPEHPDHGKIYVASHGGRKEAAIKAETSDDLASIIESSPLADTYALDELQFYDDGVIDIIKALLGEGCRVIASALDMDFRGEPFNFINSQFHVGELMPIADHVQLTAVCKYLGNDVMCGNDANYTQRLVNGSPANYNDPIIMVGAKNSYTSRCHKHLIVPGKPVYNRESLTNGGKPSFYSNTRLEKMLALARERT